MERGELERSIALEVARQEIAARIRRVCTEFPEGDFAALVERMAEIEVRYRLRDDWADESQVGGAPAPKRAWTLQR